MNELLMICQALFTGSPILTETEKVRHSLFEIQMNFFILHSAQGVQNLKCKVRGQCTGS